MSCQIRLPDVNSCKDMYTCSMCNMSNSPHVLTDMPPFLSLSMLGCKSESKSTNQQNPKWQNLLLGKEWMKWASWKGKEKKKMNNVERTRQPANMEAWGCAHAAFLRQQWQHYNDPRTRGTTPMDMWSCDHNDCLNSFFGVVVKQDSWCNANKSSKLGPVPATENDVWQFMTVCV